MPALLLLLLDACTALVSGWRSRRRQPLHQWEFFGHFLMDWLWLPPLLAVNGSAANPFVTLPRNYSWLMVGLGIAINPAQPVENADSVSA